jgi:hypothetical protein
MATQRIRARIRPFATTGGLLQAATGGPAQRSTTLVTLDMSTA